MSHLDDAAPLDGADAGFAGLPSAYADPTLEVRETPRAARVPRRGEDRPAPLRRVVEAILFASDRPVTVEQLLVALPGREAEEVETVLMQIQAELDENESGFRLLPAAGGFQIRTDPQMHEYVTRFLVGKRRSRLSRAAMETLAIIAYRQPVTRGECEEIRGVDSGQVLHTLLERNLVTFRGRSQALGRPHLYGTTEEFLRYFGLRSLADLPSPEELQALLGDDPLSDPEIRSALQVGGFEAAEDDGGGEEERAEPGGWRRTDHSGDLAAAAGADPTGIPSPFDPGTAGMEGPAIAAG